MFRIGKNVKHAGGPVKNKETVLITGATSGIGNAFARIFAERGYDLFLASRNQAKMGAMKKEFEDRYGNTVTTMSIDLATPSSARQVYEETTTRQIEIQILVNNAGFGLVGLHTGLDLRKVEEMIQLNITTPTALCLFFGDEMRKKKKGYILNVASTAAYQPTPYTAVYGATKSYLLNFSEALAKELEDDHIGVTCLSPGPTDTNFFDAVGVDGFREKKKGVWAKSNLMEPGEVAAIGVNALFAGKLSVVAGNWNAILAFSNRLAPRRTAAKISKKVMKQSTSD